MNPSPSLRIAAALLFGAAGAAAQTSTLDEGTFRIAVQGAAAGTETFTIQRSGAGANATIVAQGRVVMETGERVTTALQLQGAGLRPAAYQIRIEGGDRQNITGRAAGNRFRATVISDDGEEMREFLVDQGAVILDDGIAHH
ncbi:MAG: hypothetical protein ACOCUW_05660, partial [Gemmatimonadota bacterium]